VLWDGLDARGQRLPTGRYQLDVVARSMNDSAADTVAVAFDIRYAQEVLEDLLPALSDSMLLPERQPRSVAQSRLAAGLLVGMFAAAVPAALGHEELDGTRTHSVVVASVSISSGIAGFMLLRRRATIPENVRENARRRDEHARRNEAIRARNEVRLREARLVITPVGGEAP
jgi:hypothetical protein